MKLYKFTALALAAMVSTSALAQETEKEKVEATIAADIVTNYLWRGQKLGEGSIQPTLGLEYKGISLSAWGNFGITNVDDTKEFDLTLSYTTGGFSVGVIDYFFTNKEDQVKYFKYDAHETAHVWEAFVGYDFDFLSFLWYTNFAGADGLNKSGKRAYSSYFEFCAPFKLGSLDWGATVGAVPYATSFYSDANGFAVTNVSVKASKDLKITDKFSVPVFAQVTANPSTQKAYFALGFTLQP